MSRALIIGGTRFIGRHLVEELLAAQYDVTLLNRGRHENPFADHDGVSHITGDRTSGATLANAAEEVEPDIVVDCVAYYPGEVRMATKAFSDVEAYVFISSGSSYGPDHIPKREGETPLEPCTDEQAVDDSSETYGARKAEGDRAIFEAAENGVNAMAIRPTIVYGPYDYTGRFHYWVRQVKEHDTVLVPGDGTNIHHIVSVQNVVRGIRAIAEHGTAGEVYNVGDRRVLTLGETVETIADILNESVEVVTAGERELATEGIELTDFPLYNPNPHILSTEKLHSLGWNPYGYREAFEEAIAWDASPAEKPGPDRTAVESVIEFVSV